jgi:hypothetical protein
MFSNTKIAVLYVLFCILVTPITMPPPPPPHTLPSPYACPIWSAYFTQPEFVYNNVAYTQN